jgi:hypothetical protein
MRAVLQMLAGILLCFVLTSLWDIVVVKLYGHRGVDRPLEVAFALSMIIQIGCAAALWRHWRKIAIGFLIYIGVEMLWMPLAITIFHRS